MRMLVLATMRVPCHSGQGADLVVCLNRSQVVGSLVQGVRKKVKRVIGW